MLTMLVIMINFIPILSEEMILCKLLNDSFVIILP